MDNKPQKSTIKFGDSLNTTTTCTICLDTCTDECFVDPCLHKYCFSCITTWSQKSQTCPLCMRKFDKVYHNVRKWNEYDTTFITPARRDSDAVSVYASEDDFDTDSDSSVGGDRVHLGRFSGVLMRLFSSARGLIDSDTSSSGTDVLSDSDSSIHESTSGVDTSGIESSAVEYSDSEYIDNDVSDFEIPDFDENSFQDQEEEDNAESTDDDATVIFPCNIGPRATLASSSTAIEIATNSQNNNPHSQQTRYNLRKRPIVDLPPTELTVKRRRKHN